VRSPYVEFDLGDAAEHLYLMFFVTTKNQRLAITADFGFSTTKLGSLPLLECPAAADRDELTLVLDKARDFAFAQVDRAVEVIERNRKPSRRT